MLMLNQPAKCKSKSGAYYLLIDKTQRLFDTNKLKVYNLSLRPENYCFDAFQTLLFITLNKWYNLFFMELSTFK